jgi:hypothetical protein
MSRATHALIPLARTIFGLLTAIVLFGRPGQAQTGRILVDNTGPSILEFNTDASNGFAITGNTDNNVTFAPSVAGNGTIAFTANTDVDGTYLGQPYIFLMNADGTNVRNITPSLPPPSSNCCYDLSPAISPDGTMVAFLAKINQAPNGNAQQEIYLVNADGSNLRQLTPFSANSGGDYSQSSMYSLAWSPDSSTLAFRGTVWTTQCGNAGGAPILVPVIGTIGANGTNMQFLACDNGDGYVTSIDWSPDGTLIAWGRNVSHGAQGCSGCVGEPAIAFFDFTGQGRYSSGITSGQLGTDSCQGGPHCIHFSPDSTQLAYVDAYPNGNPCQSVCNVSFINLDGTGQTNSTIPSGGQTVWWIPGAAIPAPAQITIAGPNGPGSTVEVWPGSPQQVTPTLADSSANLILHTAQTYSNTQNYGTYGCLTMGPYGLAVFTNRDGQNAYGTISASNAGLASNTINYKCWQSPPCTFILGSAYTNIPASGGTGMVSVTANPGSSGSTCPWSSIPGAFWIMITSGASGSGNGSVNFTVAANSGAARQATITIAGLTYTVNQDASTGGGATLNSITVTPNPASVAAGLTQQFTATGNYSDGSMKNITASATWSSSSLAVATINAGGLASGVARGGPVTITAALGGVSGTAQLAVTLPVLQTITVSPSSASIAAGLTRQFTAMGTYSDGSMQTLTASATWTSSNTSVATIASGGLATGVAAGGPATITAAQNGISGTAQLTVTVPVLQSIAVSPASTSIAAGLTRQFAAMGHYSDASMQDITSTVTWSSSDTGIATISNRATTAGLARGLTAGGPVTITAALGAISGTAQLTVTAPLLISINLAPANPVVIAGSNQQFTATGNYTNGPHDITGSVTWASSNTAVATINTSGLASARSSGSSTISAHSGGVSGSTTMTVVTLQSVAIAPVSMTIFAGSTLQFTATGHYSDGSVMNVTSSAKWTSSKPTTASISSTGLAMGLINGATTITAAYDGFSAATTLTVNAVLLQSIVISPTSVTIPAGGKVQFYATGYYNNGSVQDLTALASWSANPKWLASINSTGFATGGSVGPCSACAFPGGTATVNAKYQGVVGSATLTVLP